VQNDLPAVIVRRFRLPQQARRRDAIQVLPHDISSAIECHRYVAHQDAPHNLEVIVCRD